MFVTLIKKIIVLEKNNLNISFTFLIIKANLFLIPWKVNK